MKWHNNVFSIYIMNESRFNNSDTAKSLIKTIHKQASRMGQVNIMEVCGTHTMEIARFGLRSLLPANVSLISGPGCPVCVTPASYIDSVVDLCKQNVYIVTFGDMVRVPGSAGSLANEKANGALVDVVTTPLAAIDIAKAHPQHKVVFTSVGFETTQPATARAVVCAQEAGLANLSFLCAHRVIPPALVALINDPLVKVSGFLLPGHVSVILGMRGYEFLDRYAIPGVVAGFFALDILGGIAELLNLINAQQSGAKNEYVRIVGNSGNVEARALIDKIYEPCDALWRGIGVIPSSGLRLRTAYSLYDAEHRFSCTSHDAADMPDGCSCGNVLKGIIKPDECPLFKTICTPDHPVGPCMVSSEGACAAYFKYGPGNQVFKY